MQFDLSSTFCFVPNRKKSTERGKKDREEEWNSGSKVKISKEEKIFAR